MRVFPMELPVDTRRIGLLLLASVVPVATVAGFFLHGLLQRSDVRRLVELLVILAVAVGIAKAMTRVLRIAFASALAVTWVLALAYFVGAGPMLATMLLLAGSLSLGSCFVRLRTPAGTLAALVAGLGLLVALAGWLLPFPVHVRAVHVALPGLLVAWRWRVVFDAMRAASHRFGAAVAAAPRAATCAIAFLGLASTAAWVPTTQFDDLAYHLALPFDLQTLRYYRMDAAASVWALAPWAGDVVHGIVQVVAGTEGRGAVTAAWLAIACASAWQLGRRLRIPIALRWWLLAAIATSPLMAGQVSGMQTELPTMAVALVLAMLVHLPGAPGAGKWWLVAALAGLLVGLKVSNVLLLAPLGLWWLLRLRSVPSVGALFRAICVGLFVGGSSYAYAALLTGNPFLPLFNGVFISPYFPPENFFDGRWLGGMDWRLPWDLMFDSSRFGELPPGGAGLLALACFVGAALALGPRRTRPIACVGIVAALLMFWQIQYVRYAIPAMTLMLVAAVAWLGRIRPVAEGTLTLAVLVSLNLAVLPFANHHLRTGLLRTTLLEGSAVAAERFAPSRAVARHLRDSTPIGASLWAYGDRVAELSGQVRITTWYDPTMRARFDAAQADPSGQAWRALIDRFGLRTIVLDAASLDPTFASVLRDVGALRDVVIGPYEIWRIPGGGQLPLLHAPRATPSIQLRFRPDRFRTIDMVLEFRCDDPGKVIFVRVAELHADRTHEEHAPTRAICGKDGRGVVQHTVHRNGDGAELVVDARPNGPMALTLSQFDVYPANAAGSPTDLAAQLRDRLAQWVQARR